jgi:hypothetical protein
LRNKCLSDGIEIVTNDGEVKSPLSEIPHLLDMDKRVIARGDHINPKTGEVVNGPATQEKIDAAMTPKWLYYEDSGVLRLEDENGEIHLVRYVMSRVLRIAGHAVKKNGMYVVQHQLVNGPWIGVQP